MVVRSFPMVPCGFPMALCCRGRCGREATGKAHKNADFVLGKSQNQGNIAGSDTKMPFLCSKCQKMGVPKGKSAQKPRFCARKARKRGFQTLKAHKNPDFVLEMPENEGCEGQKSTKTPILCSGRWEGGIGKRKSGLPANHRARFKNLNT